MASELYLGRWLQRFHARRALIERFMGRMAANPASGARFMGLVGHAIRKREALTPAFLRDVLAPR